MDRRDLQYPKTTRMTMRANLSEDFSIFFFIYALGIYWKKNFIGEAVRLFTKNLTYIDFNYMDFCIKCYLIFNTWYGCRKRN